MQVVAKYQSGNGTAVRLSLFLTRICTFYLICFLISLLFEYVLTTYTLPTETSYICYSVKFTFSSLHAYIVLHTCYPVMTFFFFRSIEFTYFCQPLTTYLMWYFRIYYCDSFSLAYASTCCRTSGNIIRHLLYDVIPLIKFLLSFVIYCVFGSTPASLYFHIRYFTNMFISMYNNVASIVPMSFPIKKSFLSVNKILPQ